MKFTVFALVACVALSACGGSSTGGGAGVASYDAGLRDLNRLSSRADDLEVTSNVQASGTVGYTGSVGLLSKLSPNSSITTDEVIGTANLSFRFGQDALTGTMGNFYAEGGERRAGSITLVEGEIGRSEASGFFVAGLEGTVFIDGALRSLDDGAVFGILQGSNADVASGLIGATGVTAGSSDISIEGVVIVER